MPIKEGAYDKSLPNLLKLKSDLGLKEVSGHNKQLYRRYARLDIVKHSFNIRVCKLWNSLPQHVIDSPTIKSFEIALDKHWQNQPLLFDIGENHENEIIV